MNIIKQKYSNLPGVKTIAILADPGCRTCWGQNFPRLLERVWRIHRPGLFLVAGDLAIHGGPDEFQAIVSALQPYPALLAAVPGDHDKPLTAFRKHLGSTRKILDIGKWRFICANTANRRFSKSESDFIENHLRRNSIILSHVPPGLDGWTFHSLQPLHSDRFLSIIDRHASKIQGAFFGHIHGYSRKVRSGVPLVVTGAVAESWTVRNNRYCGPGFFEMIIFSTETGNFRLCRMK